MLSLNKSAHCFHFALGLTLFLLFPTLTLYSYVKTHFQLITLKILHILFHAS